MSDDTRQNGPDRRTFLKGLGVATASVAMPRIWVPNKAYAQTDARGAVKHLLYIRLSGGFRFTAAFNGDVADRFNPWGRAASTPNGTEWTPSELLSRSSWLDGDGGADLRALGMQRVSDFANEIAVLPCVDHEPTAGSADGNHNTGLMRFNTGYASNGTGVFTMINYGLRDRVPQEGEVLLPAFVLGGGGMGNGTGKFAGFRPPVLQDGFSGFGFDAASSLPPWARDLAANLDHSVLERHHRELRPPIDAYIQSREATARYNEIFNDDSLKVMNGSDEVVDGISNAQMEQMFGNSSAGRNLRLALRLFRFGSPAVYMNQGGYDFHSDEDDNLPGRMDELNRLIAATHAALKMMTHPAGGTYWDHTLVVLGSEFGRTARGGKFNSAGGSDHGGDYATRWMSMPVMGGAISAAGNGGRSFGDVRAEDLSPTGKVYAYRATMKTLMDMLGCDHAEFFPADEPFGDLTA